MKRKLFLAVSLFTISSTTLASQFCEGFYHGYQTGYQQASGSSLKPLRPLCPLKPLKKLNDPDSEYEQGYLMGLREGMARG